MIEVELLVSRTAFRKDRNTVHFAGEKPERQMHAMLSPMRWDSQKLFQSLLSAEILRLASRRVLLGWKAQRFYSEFRISISPLWTTGLFSQISLYNVSEDVWPEHTLGCRSSENCILSMQLFGQSKVIVLIGKYLANFWSTFCQVFDKRFEKQGDAFHQSI